MKRHSTLSRQYMPTRLPITFTMVILLGMDIYHIPDVYRGIIYTLLSIIWLSSIGMLLSEKIIKIQSWDKYSEEK